MQYITYEWDQHLQYYDWFLIRNSILPDQIREVKCNESYMLVPGTWEEEDVHARRY